MRAIVIDGFGGVEHLVIKEIPDPQPKPGHAVIEVKAFGINHAEMHMRRGEWAEAAPVSGIECVGVVKSCPGGEFAVGTKVAALMGGLGRTINGSYAEYTRAPVTNVASIESDLPWEELAAIPESYCTAWTCLFRNLELVEGQKLVIRGGMSSFGQTALNLSVNAGAEVIATTRKGDRFKGWSRSAHDASSSKVPIFRAAFPSGSGSTRFLIWSATARSWIPSRCFAEAVAHAWQVFSAASLRYPISTPCSRCRAAYTSASSAVLFSAHRSFHYLTSRSNP